LAKIPASLRFRLRILYRLNRLRWTLGSVPGSEIHYLMLFEQAVARSGIPVPPLYPIGSAANASLLYLLFRLAGDFPALNVLELGAGQSTRLLAALHAAGRLRSVLTLEHDAQWADSVGAAVGHEVRHSPLRPATIDGIATEAYSAMLERRYDCVVVDGPPGGGRHSRWGVLEVLAHHLEPEFIVVFDDADRRGEWDTIDRFLALHPEASYVFLHAAKSQCAVFTRAYEALRYY
jgi:predicted O-methyltransferase YrrM